MSDQKALSDINAMFAAQAANDGKYSLAERFARLAVGLHPDSVIALSTLGRVLTDTGRFGEGRLLLNSALLYDPSSHATWSNLFFNLFYSGESRHQIDMLHSQWGYRQSLGLQLERGRVSTGKLRVGYISPNFGNHPGGRFMLPILREHRNIGKVTAYCYHTGTTDSYTGVMRGWLPDEQWRWFPVATDDEIYTQICDDKIDVLVDLSGHTNGNRLGVFNMHPAPMQVTWLDYPCHPGTPSIDFYLTNQGAGSNIKTLNYDAPFIVCDPFTPKWGRCHRTGERNTIFGAVTRLVKISDTTIHLWSRVLRAVPGSRLLLKCKGLDDPATLFELKRRFYHGGLDPVLVDIEGADSFDDYLSVYARMDVMLDTTPYAAGATAYDCLGSGVPLVAYENLDVYTTSNAPSLLRATGHHELIARTPEQYVEIAARLASDPGWIDVNDINRQLPGLAQQLTSELEKLYLEMF